MSLVTHTMRNGIYSRCNTIGSGKRINPTSVTVDFPEDITKITTEERLSA